MQSVVIHQIPVGPMANFSYLIEDAATKKCAYVDPGWESEKVAAFAKVHGLMIEAIWITHTHFDHIQDLANAVAALKVPVWAPALEIKAIEETGITAKAIHNGERLCVGQAQVEAIHTPGHTPGEMCFYAHPHLITGDVLFVNGCGRVDLPGSDPEKMFQTLSLLARMPNDVVIYPGHDYGPYPTDTLGNQKKTNPYLRSAIAGKETFFEKRGI